MRWPSLISLLWSLIFLLWGWRLSGRPHVVSLSRLLGWWLGWNLRCRSKSGTRHRHSFPCLQQNPVSVHQYLCKFKKKFFFFFLPFKSQLLIAFPLSNLCLPCHGVSLVMPTLHPLELCPSFLHFLHLTSLFSLLALWGFLGLSGAFFLYLGGLLGGLYMWGARGAGYPVSAHSD